VAGNEVTAPLIDTTPLHLVNRSKFIGGSDIASVTSISPWKSRVQLWHDKCRPRLDLPERAALRRGKRWESVVAEMLVDELHARGHAVEIVGGNVRYLDQLAQHFACEIDFEVKLDGADEVTNVELKTVHPFKTREWGESDTDDVPDWYAAQAQWGMMVTDRKRCIVAALFGADRLTVHPIERDDEVIALLRRAASEFWQQHVLTDTPPAATELDDADLLHPHESGHVIEADDTLQKLLAHMRRLRAEIDAREAEKDSLELAVKVAMGSASMICVGKQALCTWRNSPRPSLDQKALKAAHKQLVEQFTRTTDVRTFRLTTSLK
jgi:putative phage-type endonuclease